MDIFVTDTKLMVNLYWSTVMEYSYPCLPSQLSLTCLENCSVSIFFLVGKRVFCFHSAYCPQPWPYIYLAKLESDEFMLCNSAWLKSLLSAMSFSRIPQGFLSFDIQIIRWRSNLEKKKSGKVITSTHCIKYDYLLYIESCVKKYTLYSK